MKAINFLSENQAANTEFTFNINTIRNPSVATQDFTIEVATITPFENYKIDIGTFVLTRDKITAGTVNKFTVTP